MASIRKLPDGRWQAQFRPVPGGKQVTKTGRTKGPLQAWLNEQTAAVVTGTYASQQAGKQSLRDFYAEWSPRQVWESSTASSMRIAIESTPFLDRPLRDITRAHVEEWVKLMQTKPRGKPTAGEPQRLGLAPGTIATRVQNVRTVLRAAIADRKLTHDPTVGVRLPRRRRREVAMRIPTHDEVRRWLDGADPHWRALLAVCAFAGLRLGEAAALRVGDVHFLRNPRIEVRRQVQRVKGGTVEVRAPKHGSERDVPAADGLLREIAAHIALRGLQGQPDAWLFPSENGRPAHQNTVGYAWNTALTRAGLEGIVLHDLRHYYASGLIEAGCSVATVQHALGHASPSVTLNTYTHLWPSAEDQTRIAAQGLVDAVLRTADESLTNESIESAR
jgi:integrase